MGIPVIFAVVLHEIAHGYVAFIRGDDTAKRMGRLSLNPLRHLDPVGSFILPIGFYLATGFIFGLAKPVPVDFSRLHNPRKDMMLVASAGPITNIILAVASAALLKIVIYTGFGISGNGDVGFLSLMLYFSVMINVILAVINLIPILPADGGRIMAGLLPRKQAEAFAKTEPFGLFLLLFLIFMNPFGIIDITVRPIITLLQQFLLTI